MVEWAEKYIGIPYKLHSWGFDGCDCYGLIALIYKNELGIKLPRYDESYSAKSDSNELAKIYEAEVKRWKEISKPEVGCVVYFVVAGSPKHVGIVVDDKHFVHNLKSPQSSMMSDFTSSKWKDRLIGFYKYE